MMNNTQHYSELGAANVYPETDRVSDLDLDLLNSRLSEKIDEVLKQKRQNLPRKGAHCQSGKDQLKPGAPKINEKKNPHEKEIKQRLPGAKIRGSRKFRCTHTIRGPSDRQHDLSVVEEESEQCIDEQNKKTKSHRGPSLIDRRMEFLFSDQGIDEHAQEMQNSRFPFRETPSGNFKVQPGQVVFNSQKVSVLVADPGNTKVKIGNEIENKFKGLMPPIPRKLFQQPQNIKAQMHVCCKEHGCGDESSYMEELDADCLDYLKPEIKLNRLGYTNSTEIDYVKLELPMKTNLYKELYRRICNYVNTDVQVVIGHEEFSCHSMVLQSYSQFFEDRQMMQNIELQASDVTVNAFVVIYDWMITGKECITLLKRDNILEIFVAAQYLGIKELEEQCWAFLDSEQVFSEDTAFILYIEAKRMNISSVKELMIPRIRKFFLMLVSSQDFVELDIDEVCVLLQSNYIAVNCEIEILMSAVRWLKYAWETRTDHIVKIMSCIRFGLISPWQLVDIKRNPENPELVKIMQQPEITKMVDDGLSYVIIKYWYGHDTTDFSHWIELLGLSEPLQRNWVGEEKNYVTYRQFVAFLDTYRRDNLLEMNNVKSRKISKLHLEQPSYPPLELLEQNINNLEHYQHAFVSTDGTNNAKE